MDKSKPNRLFSRCLVVAATLTFSGIAGITISSMWETSYLSLPAVEGKSYQVALAAIAAPPPAAVAKNTPVKVVVDFAQPSSSSDPVEDTTTLLETEVVGVEGGQDGGILGGKLGGKLEGSLLGDLDGEIDGTAATRRKPTLTSYVSASVLRKAWLAGDKPSPDHEDQLAMRRSGKVNLSSSWKICVKANGTVASFKKLISTGYPSYDRKLSQAISRWKYRPLKVDGMASQSCGKTTINYRAAKTGM